MELGDVIKIIQTNDSWKSSDLIDLLRLEDKKIINIKLCRIYGWEGLMDGTKVDICNSLDDIREILDDCNIKYDENIVDPYELVDSIEEDWNDKWSDGGGSGWVEY